MALGKSLVWLVVGVLVWVVPALGDGGYFKTGDRLTYSPEVGSTQRALISCDGTTERLWVALGDASKGQKRSEGLWILPVKGRPDQVKAELMESFPGVDGREDVRAATRRMWGIPVAMLSSQLWPLCPSAILLPTLNRALDGVEVHSEVRKSGLVTRTVTADSVAALADYLNAMTSGAPKPEQLKSFEPYVQGEFVFVVTTVESEADLAAPQAYEDGSRRDPAVLVTFPSQTPWYPMKGTRLYGKERTSVEVNVLGDWRLAPGIYTEGQRWFTQGAKREGGGGLKPAERIITTFVQVDLDGMRAELFTQEMEFVAGVPLKVTLARFIRSKAGMWVVVVVGLMIHAVWSMVAGGLAGCVRAKGFGVGMRAGLWNMLTLVALDLGVRDMEKAAPGTFKRGFVLTFSLIYMMPVAAVLVVLGSR